MAKYEEKFIVINTKFLKMLDRRTHRGESGVTKGFRWA